MWIVYFLYHGLIEDSQRNAKSISNSFYLSFFRHFRNLTLITQIARFRNVILKEKNAQKNFIGYLFFKNKHLQFL